MLSQPNADELVATPLDGSGGRGESRTLLRGRDFQCEAGSLSSSDTSSLLDGPALTAVGVLLLSGGYTQLSRSFSRTSDGELVMKVHENSTMFHVFVGGTVSGTAYVRWRPAGPAPMPGEVEK